MILAVMVSVCWAAPSEAHMRNYLFSQDYYTAKRGEIELETFNDWALAEFDHSESYRSKHQVEVEYGVTDHLQLAFYSVWKWNESDSIFYDEWKTEAKYRVFDAGTLPIDLALYAEYHNKNGSPPDDSDILEGKIIGSKNWGRWNVTANWIMEKTIQNADKMAFEWTAGVTRAWTPRFTTGLEIKDTLGDQDEFGWQRKGHQFYVMPTLGWSPTPHSKILLGPAFGVTRAADDVQLKTMIAIEF